MQNVALWDAACESVNMHFFHSVHMNVSYELYLEKKSSVKIISLCFSVNLNPIISSGGTCSLLCYVQSSISVSE